MLRITQTHKRLIRFSRKNNNRNWLRHFFLPNGSTDYIGRLRRGLLTPTARARTQHGISRIREEKAIGL